MTEDLIVYQKAYDLLLWIKPTVERFSKVHKYSIGLELEKSSIELLKSIAKINYNKDKGGATEECLSNYEVVKILIRLSKDLKLITINQYEYSSSLISEIGMMIFGLKRKIT